LVVSHFGLLSVSHKKRSVPTHHHVCAGVASKAKLTAATLASAITTFAAAAVTDWSVASVHLHHLSPG